MCQGKEEKMDFANALKEEARKTYTENGAQAYNTTSDALLDLFGTIGSLRTRDYTEIDTLVEEAFKVDPLFTMKIIFYARDIREGCGERKVFRHIIKYIANKYPYALMKNVILIPKFGRWDDMYELVGTQLEDFMWSVMYDQWFRDLANYQEKQPISLLAKWIKTPDGSSKETRRLGCLTAKKLGYINASDFKKQLRALRRHIDVTEVKMTANEWSDIEYSAVPSNAMTKYRHAFDRHDNERFMSFVTRAVNGEVKINSSTLYPYDIVEKSLYYQDKSDVLEAQWRQLPNYVEPGTNAMIIADVSGSMSGRPMATSIGLAMYFAERNVGAYHNLFMTFSSNPEVVTLKGDTLEQKIQFIHNVNWGGSTNLEAAFKLILDIAIKNNIPSEEMVKSLIIVSDMEIDMATSGWGTPTSSETWSFYDTMRNLYHRNGYEIPNVVFWNVNSRHDVFHVDAKRKGVQLCSGSSINTFKQLMGCIGMTPVEMMNKIINSERYAEIKIE